jgi:hypothetical protein
LIIFEEARKENGKSKAALIGFTSCIICPKTNSSPQIKVEALTTIPRTMKNSFKEISRPRIRLGAVSAMYIGAACIA